MLDLQTLADRVEIQALPGEYTDSAMTRDFDRFAALFTEDGALRMPNVNVEYVGRQQIRAAIEKLQGVWEFFIQNTHPGAIRLEGDTATGRAYIAEFGRLRSGDSHQNYAIYHDRYERTPDGWKFAERVYEVRYLDSSPLPGTTSVESLSIVD